MMTIRLQNCARLVVIAGVFAFLPVHVSSNGLSYEPAWANQAGGKGNGKGQGASHAGGNGKSAGKGGANSSATSAGVGLAKGQVYDVNGRINALVKSNAWNNPNSQIGKMAQALTAAFEGYLSTASITTDPAVTTDTAAPLPTDLVSLLATISNKNLTQEDLDAVEARIAAENPENTLLQSLADPTDPTDPNLAANPQLQTTLQSFDEALIAQVNGVKETNQGLGPIY